MLINKNAKVLKVVWIICLITNVLFLPACSSLGINNTPKWQTPKRPKSVKVKWEPMGSENGVYLSEKESCKLADNIEDLNAYIQKLEALITTIEEYYE